MKNNTSLIIENVTLQSLMQENFPHLPGPDSKKPPVLGPEPQKWPAGRRHEEMEEKA